MKKKQDQEQQHEEKQDEGRVEEQDFNKIRKIRTKNQQLHDEEGINEGQQDEQEHRMNKNNTMNDKMKNNRIKK